MEDHYRILSSETLEEIKRFSLDNTVYISEDSKSVLNHLLPYWINTIENDCLSRNQWYMTKNRLLAIGNNEEHNVYLPSTTVDFILNWGCAVGYYREERSLMENGGFWSRWTKQRRGWNSAVKENEVFILWSLVRRKAEVVELKEKCCYCLPVGKHVGVCSEEEYSFIKCVGDLDRKVVLWVAKELEMSNRAIIVENEYLIKKNKSWWMEYLYPVKEEDGMKIILLQHTVHELKEALEVQGQKVQEEKKVALKYKRQKKDTLAKHHFKLYKLLDGFHIERSNTLFNIEAMLLKLNNMDSNRKIVKAYSMATDTLKKSQLNVELVQQAMDDWQQCKQEQDHVTSMLAANDDVDDAALELEYLQLADQLLDDTPSTPSDSVKPDVPENAISSDSVEPPESNTKSDSMKKNAANTTKNDSMKENVAKATTHSKPDAAKATTHSKPDAGMPRKKKQIQKQAVYNH